MRDANDFLALSKACKRQAPELRKEMNRELRSVARPLVGITRQAFRSGLPQSGGLAREISRRPMRVKIATGADPGISIVAAKTDPRIDDGRVVHPVFNRVDANGKRVMVTQQVRPRLFSGTLEREAPAVVPAIEGVLEDIATRLARG